MPDIGIRIVFFSAWGDGIEDAAAYLDALPSRDPGDRLQDPDDLELRRMARLDMDWNGECLRCFSALSHPGIDFRPARITGIRGLLEYATEGRLREEETWLVLIDQAPHPFESVIGRILETFTGRGGKVFYWAYDDASRNMPCFSPAVAPHLSVLIHDEDPLAPAGLDALPEHCLRTRQSWTANIVPFSAVFRDDPREEIVFLGSALGVTEHRTEQMRALEKRFGNRFRAITDHTVTIGERANFTGSQAHLCPEGRKFTSRSMSRSHTDRPFWAGCMGQVPVSEDSRYGGRLRELVDRDLVIPYPHGDTEALLEACERALTTGPERRRELYEYFNRFGTIGPAAARHLARYYGIETEEST